MTQAVFFPKGQDNSLYLVFGSVYHDNDSIELRINQSFDEFTEAEKFYKKLKEIYQEGIDIGIQKHTINNIDVSYNSL